MSLRESPSHWKEVRFMMRRFTSLTLAFLIGCLLCALVHAQTVTVSPTSLSFGSQVVSTTSAAKAVTLKNGQSVVLTISSIAASGDYAQSNNCGTSLAAGASCIISVKFTPTTTGTRTGTLTVTDNASNSPQTVSLTGSGVLPAALTPTSLSFGSQVVGTTSAAKTVTLKNNQTVSLAISSITTSGDYAQTSTCGTSLATGTSCTISVTFTPTTTGTRTGTLTVADSATNSPQTTTLTGTGLIPASVAPTSLGFGSEVVNTTSVAKIATLTNNQAVALNISSIATTGDYAQTNACGASLAAKASCTISVTFTPTTTGTRTGSLTVTDSATNSPQAVSLTGTGTAAPHIASLSPTSGVIGTSITITGSGFGSSQGLSTVTFNGTVAAPTSWTGSKIVAPVPPGAISGNVVVTVDGSASNGSSFTVLLPPNITSLSPNAGAVGTYVSIAGTNFGTAQGTSTITFNGTAATPTSWSDTFIFGPVPTGATTGNVMVTVGGQASNGFSFPVNPASVPVITGIEGASGGEGTPVTITGTNFGATQGTSTVAFNGTSSTPMSWSTSSIVAPVPTGAATGNLVVTVNGFAGNGLSFTVGQPSSDPVITPVYTPTGSSRAYPNQKAIAVGADGFSRFVTGDSSSGYSDQIVYVRCLDQDCVTHNTAKFTTGQWTFDYSMALGPDGFARIAYSTFSNIPPGHNSFLGFIQCSDADCISFTNTVVDGASDNGVASIAVGSDGTSYIVYDYGYDFYDNVSAYDEQGVGLATCDSGGCGTTQIAPINVFDSIQATITIGANGSPAIVYEDSGNTTSGIPQPNSVHYYANGGDTIISSDGYGNGTGLNDIAIGLDGFAMITFANASGKGVDFIQCTNLSCSTNSISTVIVPGSPQGGGSLTVGADGDALLELGVDSPPGAVHYVTCAAADCSNYDDSPLLGSLDNSNLSIIRGLDGLPRMIAGDSQGKIDHVRKTVSAKLTQRTSDTVSSDDSALGTYNNAVGTTSLGPIILTGTAGLGCGIGMEMIGTITPSSYTGTVTLHRQIVNRRSYAGSTPTASVTDTDDTSEPDFRDDNPQSGGSAGKVYDLDAAGPGSYTDSITHRYRANFYEWAALPDGTRISPYYNYYVRISCKHTSSGYQFVNDVAGDNQIAVGETSTTWNLQ
jgi:IPT/TIG domain/Abnormal spindle-like microcephaly-assoc'd, ASPM-SPD-2-Hydin